MGSPQGIVREVLARLEGGPERRILDLPAGRGALSRHLVDRGFEVAAGDIRPEIFEVREVECRRSNLNERLPFDDASFDAIACLNGLHRVFTAARAVSEFARLLRPGGRLIITLPNFSAIKRRVRFFFTGVVSRAAVRTAAVRDSFEANHRHAVSLAEVLTAFRASGLELCHLQGAWSRPQHFRPGRFLYLPPIVCIQLVALCLRLGRRDRYFLRETASFAALFSDFLLIEARKAR